MLLSHMRVASSVRSVVELVVVESFQIQPATRLQLRALGQRAFSDRFTDDDADHAYGGVHVLAQDIGGVIGHASAVPRAIRFGDDPWRTWAMWRPSRLILATGDAGSAEQSCRRCMRRSPRGGRSRSSPLELRPASTTRSAGSSGVGSRTPRPRSLPSRMVSTTGLWSCVSTAPQSLTCSQTSPVRTAGRRLVTGPTSGADTNEQKRC